MGAATMLTPLSMVAGRDLLDESDDAGELPLRRDIDLRKVATLLYTRFRLRSSRCLPTVPLTCGRGTVVRRITQ